MVSGIRFMPPSAEIFFGVMVMLVEPSPNPFTEIVARDTEVASALTCSIRSVARNRTSDAGIVEFSFTDAHEGNSTLVMVATEGSLTETLKSYPANPDGDAESSVMARGTVSPTLATWPSCT